MSELNIKKPLKVELQEEKEKAVRAVAEMENMRRRSAQFSLQAGIEAEKKLIKSMLPAFLALKMGAKTTQDENMAATVNHFFEMLQKKGLEEINPEKDEELDPQKHEVLLQAEGKAGCVVQTLESGWAWQESVIKTAKVSAGVE